VPEGSAVGVQICGVPIVLRRSKGKVYALKDQCLHRGVKLSAKPMCLTEDTITCWYHGFTFSIETGELVSIVAAPDDEIIGTTGIPTYPVEEVNGIVFVFVKSDDWEDEIPCWPRICRSASRQQRALPHPSGRTPRACSTRMPWPWACTAPATPTGAWPARTASTPATC
jgi:phenylpropionate dioxygenase-like ring-hydroxylating dioxygenase large terminal subunit